MRELFAPETCLVTLRVPVFGNADSETTNSVGLVRAQDTLDNAQSEDQKLQAYDDLETLKKARQDLFVRWTMDRHVSKLKRLEGGTTHKESGRKFKELGWKVYSQEVPWSTSLPKA